MTRRSLFALFAAAPAGQSAPAEPCQISIFVDRGPSVQVTIPHIRKEDLVSIAATFFGRDKPKPTEEIGTVLRKATDVTLVLTTKCEKAG